jgi:polyhydroxybutyrate depolymerase
MVKQSLSISTAIAIAIALSFLSLTDAIAVSPQQRKPLQHGTLQHTMRFDGIERTYLVHVPLKYDGKTRVPVVIMLHGFGGNSKNGLEQGKWVEKSEQEGFLAIGLDGTLKHPTQRESFLNNPRSWNSGGLTNNSENMADDVGFINAAIDQVGADFSVDTNRIYVTGFSNGAAMTFRVGVELSDRIAAIAPVANSLLTNSDRLKYPVALLMIWGTADPLNPIDGGQVRRAGKISFRPSAIDSWKKWGQLLHCSLTPQTIQTIYDRNGVKGQKFISCEANSEAAFYTIDGMGHNWPGGRNVLPERIVGKKSNAIDATDLIWEFFKQHPRRSSQLP